MGSVTARLTRIRGDQKASVNLTWVKGTGVNALEF